MTKCSILSAKYRKSILRSTHVHSGHEAADVVLFIWSLARFLLTVKRFITKRALNPRKQGYFLGDVSIVKSKLSSEFPAPLGLVMAMILASLTIDAVFFLCLIKYDESLNLRLLDRISFRVGFLAMILISSRGSMLIFVSIHVNFDMIYARARARETRENGSKFAQEKSQSFALILQERLVFLRMFVSAFQDNLSLSCLNYKYNIYFCK